MSRKMEVEAGSFRAKAFFGLIGTVVAASSAMAAHRPAVPSASVISAAVAPATLGLIEEDLYEPGSWLLNPTLVRRRAIERLWEFGDGVEPVEDSVLVMVDLPDGGLAIEPQLAEPDSDPDFEPWRIEVLDGQETAVGSNAISHDYVNETTGDPGVLFVTVDHSVAHFVLAAPDHMDAMIADITRVTLFVESSTGDSVSVTTSYVTPVEVAPAIPSEDMWSLEDHSLSYAELALGETFDDEAGTYSGPMGPRPHGLAALECGRVRPGTAADNLCRCWTGWAAGVKALETVRKQCIKNAQKVYMLEILGCAIAGVSVGVPTGPFGVLVGPGVYFGCSTLAMLHLQLMKSQCEQAYANGRRALRIQLTGCVNRNNQNSQDGGPFAPPAIFDPRNVPSGLRPSQIEEYPAIP